MIIPVQKQKQDTGLARSGNMKLTESKLKKLIVEVINEVRIAPEPPSVLSTKELAKIHELINSGQESYINMAKSIIDGKKGDPNYVDQYISYIQEVGDLEKLGNQVADMYEPAEYLSRRPLKPGFSEEDVLATDAEAYKLAASKAAKPGYETQRYDSPYGEITISPYEAMMDRYYRTRNPRPEDMLNESEVPQEAKEKLFARMKRLHQVPTGATIEDAEFWEVKDGDYGFRDNKTGEITAIKANGKYYYGEI